MALSHDRLILSAVAKSSVKVCYIKDSARDRAVKLVEGCMCVLERMPDEHNFRVHTDILVMRFLQMEPQIPTRLDSSGLGKRVQLRRVIAEKCLAGLFWSCSWSNWRLQ